MGYQIYHFYWGLWLPTSTPQPSARKESRNLDLDLGGDLWTPESEFCGINWGGGLTVTFSASLASRMYLSRTRLSQMRRAGAPRTGRSRGSSSKDSRSSRAGHSRKKSQAECEAERGTEGWFGEAGSHTMLLAGASPPDPNLPSAQILFPLPSFNPAAARTPHPPSYRLHF